MKVHLIFPVLPPVLNGIGDYTACLAQVLAETCEVKILTGEGKFDPIPSVSAQEGFSIGAMDGIQRLPAVIGSDVPDWLVLQYNPFSYGRWGLSPYLPLAMRQIRKAFPETRLALMVHEPFISIESLKAAVMTTWQRWQLWMLGRQADLIFFSIDPWVRKFQSWFPGKPIRHLPVASNIPLEKTSKREARQTAGIAPDDFVIGVFGSAHPSRLLPFVKEALRRLATVQAKLRVLYVGPAGDTIRKVLGEFPLLDAGPLAPEAVSHHLSAMDLHLAPFEKGVSSRRGSFMAGIQHGVATISTYGSDTDDMLLAVNGEAFLLAPDHAMNQFGELAVRLAKDALLRRRFAERGRGFYETSFGWELTARRLWEAMEGVKGHSHTLSKPASQKITV